MPARHILGVTRATLPRKAGSGDVRAVGTATYPNSRNNSVLIDAAGEGGCVGFPIPAEWLTINTLVWMFRGVAIGTMNFTLTMHRFNCDGSYTQWINNTLQLATVVDGVYCVTLAAADFAGLGAEPGDMLFMGVEYRVAGGGGLATNILYLGGYATET